MEIMETISASKGCLRAHSREGRSLGIPTDVGVYSMSEDTLLSPVVAANAFN